MVQTCGNKFTVLFLRMILRSKDVFKFFIPPLWSSSITNDFVGTGRRGCYNAQSADQQTSPQPVVNAGKVENTIDCMFKVVKTKLLAF